jgi:WD40 repeat protein
MELIAEHIHPADLFKLMMLVFKNNRIRGHFELGRLLCDYIIIERSYEWADASSTHLFNQASSPEVTALAVSSRGKIAMGLANGRAFVIDHDAIKHEIDMNDFQEREIVHVKHACFSADESSVLFGNNKRINVYDVTEFPPKRTFEFHSERHFRVDFVRDNHTLVIVRGHDIIAVSCQLNLTRVIWESLPNSFITAAAIAPNKLTMCTIISTERLILFNLSPATVSFAKMTCSEYMDRSVSRPSDLALVVFSEDSRRIIVTDYRQVIAIVDAKTGDRLHSIDIGSPIRAPIKLVCVNTLIAYTNMHGVYVVDQAGTHTKLATMIPRPSHPIMPFQYFYYIAWSPSKQALLVATNYYTEAGMYSDMTFVAKKKT